MEQSISLFFSIGVYFLINAYIFILILKSKTPIVVSALFQQIAILICFIPFVFLSLTVAIPEKFPFLIDFRWAICLALVLLLVFGILRNRGNFSIIGLKYDILTQLELYKINYASANSLIINNKSIHLSNNKYFYITHFYGSVSGYKEMIFLKNELKKQAQNHLINKKSLIFYAISLLFSLTSFCVILFI